MRSAPIDRLTQPMTKFMKIEASGGIVLLICVCVAVFFANSPWAAQYNNFWKTYAGFHIASFNFEHSLLHWINDGLMTIFFFVVGLEIKREFVKGELKDRRDSLLPILAAVGGMVAPAAIYVLLLAKDPGIRGWGIPMATDIAFVVGFMSLLGNRVPRGLKVFLLSLAIVDDMGAVLIIAVFYSSSISYVALFLGAAGFLLAFMLNRAGVRQVSVYVIVGVLIWFAFSFSGIHPTVSGVLLGFLTPASAWIGDSTFAQVLAKWTDQKKSNKGDASYEAKMIHHLIDSARETVSPLERLERSLHPWVAFGIVPVFALANAAVPFAADTLFSQISIGVALGLFIGKPIGILIFSFIAVRFLRCRLPRNVTWANICGTGFLAGIGFTMSIFIAGMALEGSMLTAGKVGTLLGSFFSLLVGLGVLHFTLPRPASSK